VRTSVAIFVLTVASFVLGLARDLAIAKYFGASWVSDALFLALVVPVFFENIFGIALRDALIPRLKLVFLQDPSAYGHEVNRLGAFALFASTGILIIFQTVPRFWVNLLAPGWDVTSLNLATQLYTIAVFLVVIHAWGYFQTAVLNSEGIFVLPMWRSVLFNVGALLGIALYPEHIASVLVGMLMLLVCHSLWMQARLGARGVDLSGIGWSEMITSQLAFLKAFLPLLGATAVLQAIVISERVFSSWLQPGSLSALSYAYRLTTVPLILFSVSVLTLIFPLLVARRLSGSKDDFCIALEKGLKVALLVLIPAAVFFQVFAEPITSLLFEHGVFRAHETEMTAGAVAGYAAGLPFMGLALLGSRAILALNQSRVLLRSALVGLLVTVVAQAFCFQAWNTLGLAAAVSIGAASQAFVLWRHILQLVPLQAFWITIVRWFGAALVVGAVLHTWPWRNTFGLLVAGMGMLIGLLLCVWCLGERGIFSRQLLHFETQ
jgi:putative peptidoglycan lipid II flippase